MRMNLETPQRLSHDSMGTGTRADWQRKYNDWNRNYNNWKDNEALINSEVLREQTVNPIVVLPKQTVKPTPYHDLITQYTNSMVLPKQTVKPIPYHDWMMQYNDWSRNYDAWKSLQELSPPVISTPKTPDN